MYKVEIEGGEGVRVIIGLFEDYKSARVMVTNFITTLEFNANPVADDISIIIVCPNRKEEWF